MVKMVLLFIINRDCAELSWSYFLPLIFDCSVLLTREISLSELILSYCLVYFHHLYGGLCCIVVVKVVLARYIKG
jgi:hypothetical protein